MKHYYLFFCLMTFFSCINYAPILANDTNQGNYIQLTASDKIQSEVHVLCEKIRELLGQGFSVNAVMAILASDPTSYGVVEKMVRNICEILQHSNLDPKAPNMMHENIIIKNEIMNEEAEEFYARKNFKAKAKILAAILGTIITSILLYKFYQKLLDLFEGINASLDRGGASGLSGTDIIPDRPIDAHVQRNNIGNRQQVPLEVLEAPYNGVNALMHFAPAVDAVGSDEMLFYYEPMVNDDLKRKLRALAHNNNIV